jgi:hypothetical protein
VNDVNVLNPPACYDTASTTKPCWNGGQPTGNLAIWEVTSGGAHVGTSPIASFTLTGSENGVATFTTPDKWEILSPGQHLFRAEYQGTSADGSGPTGKQTVGVAGYYGSTSGNWTQNVYLSGLIGLNSVTIGSGTAFADSFDSSAGPYAATVASRARVLSNGNITINGSRIAGNILSANGSVFLADGSVVTGDVTGLAISGPGTIGGTPTIHSSALMTPLVPVTPCAGYTNPGAAITGNYKYDAATGALSVAGNAVVRLAGNYCFGSITITGGAVMQVETGPVTIRVNGIINAGGGSFANSSARPSNLRIESAYTGSGGVIIKGNNSSYLTIYAPGTDVSLQNGTIFGEVLGKTLSIQGSTPVHYDNAPTSAGWTIWNLWAAFFGLPTYP